LVSDISDPILFPDVKLYSTSFLIQGTAICLPGIGIFVHHSIHGNNRLRVLQHEYGHFLDFKTSKDLRRKRWLKSNFLGFYLGIGIPSLLNTIPLFNKIPSLDGNHREYWTELRANRLAKTWFGDRLVENFSSYHPTQKA
jgi:hypothetical protein